MAIRRMTPAARMRPTSARRASGVMRSGGMERGLETGSDGLLVMAAFRDVNDGPEATAKSLKYKYFNDLCDADRLWRLLRRLA